MCGLLGCYFNKNITISDNNFLSILDFINHRGPDNTGIKRYTYNNNEIIFGHKRLSILDLNKRSNQPMEINDGRYSLIFNGEIYNHKFIRKIIETKKNINWIGTSDTETLLQLFENYEINESLKKLKGMFAFSLYDKKKNKLIIARDRSGEKPLYISTNKDFLAFSSDLNTLCKLPGFEKKISKFALQQYLKYNYVPTPQTIFENSFKLPPASFIEITLDKFKFKSFNKFDDFCSNEGVIYTKWWSIQDYIKNTNDNSLSSKNLIKETENLLENSVKSQLISDVPIGAFMSGGVDSSLIVALMQKFQKTKTYTIGYDFAEYDESNDAKKISEILSTDHNNFICTKNDLLNLIPSIPQAYSEPFSDSSQIPTMLISKIASRDLKVVLSGDGGDELFGGYNRYFLAHKYWKYINLIPYIIRKNSNHLIDYIPKKILINLLNYLNISKNLSGPIDKNINKILSKISKIYDQKSFYYSMRSEWKSSDQILNFGIKENTSNSIFDEKNNLAFIEKMMLSDFNSYLHDDILCKVDRASMFYSLETRAPFLDNEIIEHSLSLPSNMKIKNNTTKWITKKILGKYLPENLINKPKRGFAIPISEWMKKDLKNWVNDILSKDICNKHNFFNYKIVEETKNEHFNELKNNEHKLWSLIQFNQWYDNLGNK